MENKLRNPVDYAVGRFIRDSARGDRFNKISGSINDRACKVILEDVLSSTWNGTFVNLSRNLKSELK